MKQVLFDFDIHEKLLPYSDIYNWFSNAEKSRELNLFQYFRGENGNRTIYQLYHESFIDLLAEQIKNLNPSKIVEVMAGDGKLSEFLNGRHNLNIIPTDNKSWKIKYPDNVIKLDALEAVNKYKPDLVIVCWEPYESTICSDIADSSIPMIWIGEGYGGCCGAEKLFENKRIYMLNSNCCICRTDSIKLDLFHSSIYLFNWPKLPYGIEDSDWYEIEYP
jgi:hypothetical protein